MSDSETENETAVERLLIELLRERVQVVIGDRGAEWAAAVLHMSEPGVEAVLWRRDWSVGTAVHLASLLDVLTEQDVKQLVHSN